MAHDSPTQPAWPARAKKPWWATALVGGIGAGIGVGAAIAAALGLSSPPALASGPHVATAGVASTADETAAWRVRMEQKVDEALQRIAHIEGRLDRR